MFVVRGRYSPVPIESDRKGLDALVAACKEGGISGAVGGGGGSSAAAKPSLASFQGAGYSLSAPTQAEKSMCDEALAAALAASGVDPNAGLSLSLSLSLSFSLPPCPSKVRFEYIHVYAAQQACKNDHAFMHQVV